MKSLKSLVICAVLAFSALSSAASNDPYKPSFVVASYNLRQANHSDSVAGNGWGRRLPVLAELIRFHGFDIFGTQEGFKHQLDSLQARLPGYEYIGVGRDDGKDEGEHSAIFYRTDLFKLLDKGDFWLSETPDRPGLGWDAVCPRICSWGKFIHIPSGKVFVFMNLHMDHVGKKARVEAAKLVKQKISEVAGDAPAIVTGDFNVDQTHESYRTMLGNGDMLDSYNEAIIRYAPNGTFNSYHTDDFTTSRIDHVFVTPGVTINRYGVLTDTYRTDDSDNAKRSELSAAPGEIEARKFTPRTPSDHFPVMVVLTLQEP
ncbi:MAG: endonuclease/exonuclease/phosphatase family protein [Firmicutes bacterium]|nr:endonuclease/exonuclease/phosphatase family protein [Bacillota bacterium]MCM1401247.1 endonuclease/exonuclease/phosphatase family protein [Bacteroides sp.]MCM1477204.1 endonuclease/exonuclease/phosphatase family protein [Bacteroides sp.]